MKVLVLGASGGVGRHVVPLLVGRGHDVVAVVRPDTADDAPAGATVVRDDPLRAGALDAVAGRDAVVSCLGIKRAHPINPWSRLTSPADFSSTTARAIVAAMQRHGVRRVVAVSAAGVAESAFAMNAVMRFFVATSNVGVAYRDLALMERVYADSGLDWHACRPVRLVDGAATGAPRMIDGFPTTAKVRRADVAVWLADRVERGDLVPRTPSIAGP